MIGLRLLAPAKINWTLEVLGKRPDGYHEVRTVMQTIDLCDEITVAPAGKLSLDINGSEQALRDLPREDNLAYRAAQLLWERAGFRGGARIVLAKRIPVAAGLGGGSSDAAAVLRGLRRLWALNISDRELTSIAAQLGSDVPFFLRGGTAVASGRGEVIQPLPDAPVRELTIAWPSHAPRPDKTARMYAALRPEHYTDGSATARLAERLRRNHPPREEDLYNAFEAVVAEVDPDGDALLNRARASLGSAHLCGSGPAVFSVSTTRTSAQAIGETIALVRTMSADECIAIREDDLDG